MSRKEKGSERVNWILVCAVASPCGYGNEHSSAVKVVECLDRLSGCWRLKMGCTHLTSDFLLTYHSGAAELQLFCSLASSLFA